MLSFIAPAVVLAALAALPAVSAHGFVSEVIAGGTTYTGVNDPIWFYSSTKPQKAGWFAHNQDLGFVAPSAFGDPNITCHRGATPGTTYIDVTAGETITIKWSGWPVSHHGPVIDYMARCKGECTSVNKDDLIFFKLHEEGLDAASPAPGSWASDKLIANGNSWSVTIPPHIAPGNFVLRHEIIALHSAYGADGAQAYPQCINLKVSGTGTHYPCRTGATCPKGVNLYKATDPGVLINIYTALSGYKIPGPPVFATLMSKVKRVAETFKA